MRTAMRLRNVVLVSILTLAGGALALEFAARTAAQRMSRALSNIADLTYDSAHIALDGSVRLRAPRLEIRKGLWRGTVHARSADLRGSGPAWLVAHMVSDGGGIPPSMSISTHGLILDQGTSHMSAADWFGTPDLALFENLGCGNDALSDKDRARMGVVADERKDHFDYRFDATSKHLDLNVELDSSNIANWRASAEWTGFDPGRWPDKNSLHALRLVRAGLSYRDPGYLARRNRFCADWLGVSPDQFVERHMAALQTFLTARGVEPSADVLSLYQRLVARGGTLNISSLPDAAWLPAEFDAYPRQVLLRQLNITARLEDAPPIMLRLAFTEPEVPLFVVKPVDSAPAEAPPGTAITSEPAALVESVGKAMSAPVSTSPSAAVPAPEPVIEAPSDPPVPAPLTEVATPASGDAGQLVGGEPDRRVVASAPPPPQNSTLALVWKPGQIERLPPATPKERRYEVIPPESLGKHVGRRVQLVTAGGKLVDGDVRSLEAGNVVMTVQRGRGSAELSVPLANISEARLVGARGGDS